MRRLLLLWLVLAGTLAATAQAPLPKVPARLADLSADVAIATPAAGDVLVRGPAKWTNLPAGAPGYFLQSAGPGAVPAWSSASPTAPVQSVAGRTGNVTLAQADVTGLVAGLAAKADDAGAVHKAGAETITDPKSFAVNLAAAPATFADNAALSIEHTVGGVLDGSVALKVMAGPPQTFPTSLAFYVDNRGALYTNAFVTINAQRTATGAIYAPRGGMMLSSTTDGNYPAVAALASTVSAGHGPMSVAFAALDSNDLDPNFPSLPPGNGTGKLKWAVSGLGETYWSPNLDTNPEANAYAKLALDTSINPSRLRLSSPVAVSPFDGTRELMSSLALPNGSALRAYSDAGNTARIDMVYTDGTSSTYNNAATNAYFVVKAGGFFQLVGPAFSPILMFQEAGANSTLALGGGAAFKSLVSATATLDFPATAAQSSADLTIAVAGAAVGDSVELGLPAAVAPGTSFLGWVSGANTVTVRHNNYSAAAVDPAAATFRATATHF